MPTAAMVVTSEEPPKLINGSGTPVKGISATTEPIFRKDCTAIQHVKPTASSAPYLSGARPPAYSARATTTPIKSTTTTQPIKPSSSPITAKIESVQGLGRKPAF